MGTLAEKLQKLATTKAAIKAAIIGKGQTVADSDTFASYADKIRAIQTGTDTSDADMIATDLRAGRIGYGAAGKITGTVPDVKAASPSISVSSAGVITASATQSAGFVSEGTQETTYAMPLLVEPTITPTASGQTIEAAGKYSTVDITVMGDSNLVPENIKDGVTIFGVTGTAKGSEAVTGTYSGNAGIRVTTPQSINLGFQPKFVFVSEENLSLDSNAPWYYYSDCDDAGDKTSIASTVAAYAFVGSPMKGIDEDDNEVPCLEITDNGFNVANAYNQYSNSAGTSSWRTTVYINRTNHTYRYLAIP